MDKNLFELIVYIFSLFGDYDYVDIDKEKLEKCLYDSNHIMIKVIKKVMIKAMKMLYVHY